MGAGNGLGVELSFFSGQEGDNMKMRVQRPYGNHDAYTPGLPFHFFDTSKIIDFINLTDDSKARMTTDAVHGSLRSFLQDLSDDGLIPEPDMSLIRIQYHPGEDRFSIRFGSGETLSASRDRQN
ncbi:hypothetical protein FOZ63_019786 [Perkinsus olseni]|uniref:Uncharacterized protein n=1 Tax=Perkinsus olseni TaxID=32597 RepID=A0A7J6T4J8_PEROL|nr:hypothetical protein FOZ62_031611 [Perkinsus olseni]KAF4750117.1 hypothetical protein FOZ63_019786 [Perkinsus olseni]